MRLDFWFDFASTYSYLAAMRIEPLAASRGVEVRWRPFLLGPIFKAQGWDSSPFNLYPAKGRYMWRDMERQAKALGLPLTPPDPFPQNSLLPARVALTNPVTELRPQFCRALFAAEFGDGKPISDPATLAAILSQLGLEAEPVLAEAGSDPVKLRLRDETAEAQRLGIFGAPTFITEDGELFWGNDRLEQALCWRG